MPPRIFVSYRREDAAGDAGRLADHLTRRFGRGQVFLDIDTIDPGTDFVRVLQSSLRETAAVLVVIGFVIFLGFPIPGMGATEPPTIQSPVCTWRNDACFS